MFPLDRGFRSLQAGHHREIKWRSPVPTRGGSQRGRWSFDVNPLTVRERLFVVLMSHERAETEGTRGGEEGVSGKRVEKSGRERVGRGTTLTRVSHPLFELCQARYIFRFALASRRGCKTIVRGWKALGTRASFGCTYSHGRTPRS